MIEKLAINDLPVSQDKQYCFHCDSPCLDDAESFDNHPFCCHGCRTVYEIISENNMDYYYSINSSPGNKYEDTNKQSSYTMLPVYIRLFRTDLFFLSIEEKYSTMNLEILF